MKIADVRRAITALDDERRHLCAVPAADFISLEVDDRLRPLMTAVASIPIAKKYDVDNSARDAAVQNASDLIAHWREARGASARVRKAGCCGR